MIFPFAQVGYVIVSCLLRRAIAALQQQIFIDVAGGAHDHHALLLQIFSDFWAVFWRFWKKCSPFLRKIKSSGWIWKYFIRTSNFWDGMILSTTMPPIYSIESIAGFVGKRWWWYYSIYWAVPAPSNSDHENHDNHACFGDTFSLQLTIFLKGQVYPPKQTVPTP